MAAKPVFVRDFERFRSGDLLDERSGAVIEVVAADGMLLLLLLVLLLMTGALAVSV